MKIRYEVVSHVGCVRSNNEDIALVLGKTFRDASEKGAAELHRHSRLTALVSDGMGGYEGGEVASEMVVDSFADYLLSDSLPTGMDTDDVVASVNQWVAQAQAAIAQQAALNQKLNQMGATFTGIFGYEGQLFLINVGDSRAYRLRDGVLKRLTTDHSLRELHRDESLPSNVIYNAFGLNDVFAHIKCITQQVLQGDAFLICSDGLHDMVDDETIERMLSDGCSAQALVDKALENGGEDNVTVVLLFFDDMSPATDRESESLNPHDEAPLASETMAPGTLLQGPPPIPSDVVPPPIPDEYDE